MSSQKAIVRATTWNKAHPEERKATNAKYRKAHLERVRTNTTAWRKAYPEKIKASRAAYYKTHLKQTKVRQMLWKKANRDHVNGYARTWSKANLEKRSTCNQRRRALKRGAPGSHTTEQWLALIIEYDHKCAYCRDAKSLTRDHVIPLSCGGSNDISNIVPACRSCNSSKHTKTGPEFVAQLSGNDYLL